MIILVDANTKFNHYNNLSNTPIIRKVFMYLKIYVGRQVLVLLDWGLQYFTCEAVYANKL